MCRFSFIKINETLILTTAHSHQADTLNVVRKKCYPVLLEASIPVITGRFFLKQELILIPAYIHEQLDNNGYEL